MRRKKILFCSEGHFLPTGYSVYTKEVLSRLSVDPRFEVAELACYVDQARANEEAKNCNWFIFPNQPAKDSPEWHEYKSQPSYEFGEYTFNHVLLDFMPDFVVDIRDWWMFEFQQRTPFRNFFNWCIMPTVDAAPQNNQWMDTFASADAVFAYSEFGKKVLLEQCQDLNFVDIASPCASQEFDIIHDKAAHKLNFGLSEDSFILGTVMRNQRRKLFPDLFKTFREFLDSNDASNAYLYCHTSYPDIGWEIPQLLQEYGLTNRVLFTYRCKKCGHINPSFFNDVINHCYQCANFTRELVGINNKIERNELSQIYNLFDTYIQYANSEGFGMPQLEASQSGIPVITVDYSAMQSVADNIGALKVPVSHLHMECETGCNRAIPDNSVALQYITDLYNTSSEKRKQMGYNMRQKTISRYNWDDTASKWADYFDKTPVKNHAETWLSAPRILPSATEIPPNLSIKDQVDFLFNHVLRQPDWIGNHIWKRTLRDLTYKCTTQSTNVDFYFNESHLNNNIRNWGKFDIDLAYTHMAKLREMHNEWEKIRANKIQGGQR